MDWLWIALALVGHGFLWVGIVNRLHACPVDRWLLELLTKLSVGLFAVIPIVIAWTLRDGFSPMSALTSNYLWVCCLVALWSLVAKWHDQRHRYNRRVVKQSRSEKLDFTEGIDGSLFHGSFAKRLEQIPGNQSTQLVVQHRQLAIPELPTELNDLKLVHLSDMHMTGRLDRAFFERLTAEVNRIAPDVIALTGDIVEKVACLPWLETTLGKMEARLGCYFILGNHDLFIDQDESIKRIEQLGWNYVGQHWKQANWDGTTVSIGGNEMHWKGPALEAPEKQPDEFRLVLSHTPDRYPWCREAEADLTLAGHTHGGQFCVPLLGPIVSPSLYGTRYCCGVFCFGKMVLHVSRGVSGKTPLRLFCPPELSVLTLTKE